MGISEYLKERKCFVKEWRWLFDLNYFFSFWPLLAFSSIIIFLYSTLLFWAVVLVTANMAMLHYMVMHCLAESDGKIKDKYYLGEQ